MANILIISQIILSSVLVVTILLQSQGNGLGSTWGGGGETYHTRRGVEKVVYWLTIVCLVLFGLVGLALLLIA